jgi:hypothetical protein
MTALQSIIKEAKAIRKKRPTMEWKKAVAQASAIYASKHKGKSPVGKKKAKKSVGKVDKKLKKGLASKGLKMPHGYDVVKRKRKISGVIKKKAIRKTATKRKPTEKSVLKSIKHAVSVQKQHMGNIGGHAIDRIKSAMSHLSHYEHTYKKYMAMPLYEKKLFAGQIKKLRHLIKETKTHITQLKKSI